MLAEDKPQDMTVPVSGQAPLKDEKNILDSWQKAFDSNEYGMINDFIRNFLGKKHPNIGRKGPVCPFVPVSLRKDTLYLSVVRTEQNPADEMKQFLKDFAPTFEAMEPSTGLAR